MEIQDHTFLVTGGGSGLGAACVRLLAHCGGNVIVADLNTEKGETLCRELGDKARFVATDVTDEVSVQRALAEARHLFGCLHGSIQCAGIAVAEKVLGRSGPHGLASFTNVIQVNLIGTFNVNRLAVAAMADNPPSAAGERGVLINTGSIAAVEGQIGQAAYAASKGGVAALTLPLARELARLGIRVLAIAPGLFDTPLLAGLPDAARQALGQQVPFPARLGRPEEFAALVRHLIENEMLNGTVIRLDGALRMAPK